MRIILTNLHGPGHIIIDTHRLIYAIDLPVGCKICLSTGDDNIVTLEVAESAEEVFDLCD